MALTKRVEDSGDNDSAKVAVKGYDRRRGEIAPPLVIVSLRGGKVTREES